jgi:hypothetical protein
MQLPSLWFTSTVCPVGSPSELAIPEIAAEYEAWQNEEAILAFASAFISDPDCGGSAEDLRFAERNLIQRAMMIDRQRKCAGRKYNPITQKYEEPTPNEKVR